MKIDRWGNPIKIGWSQSELLWVLAAINLDVAERIAAYQDISDMSGHPFAHVRQKANRIMRETITALEDGYLHTPPELALSPSVKPQTSFVKPPTKAQLMGSR